MHQADGRVVSNFIVQALQNQPITLYGDGSQSRSFCFVDDLIGGLIALMDSPPELTGPVNLGNPEEYTIRQLAELIIAATGSRSQLVLKPLPEDDPKQRRPDIGLAQKHLAWNPSVPVATGIDRTVAYFREVLAA